LAVKTSFGVVHKSLKPPTDAEEIRETRKSDIIGSVSSRTVNEIQKDQCLGFRRYESRVTDRCWREIEGLRPLTTEIH
jgi:hypothetical protein